MALDRIAGIAQIARPQTLRGGTDNYMGSVNGTAAATGSEDELLRLLVSESLDGELHARSTDGRQFRFSAASLAATLGGHTLVPGQVLLLKVIGTSPQLELALLGTAGDGPDAQHAAGADPKALQPDQAAMRRLARPVLDTPALAAGWRSMVLVRLQQGSVVPEAGLPPDAASRNAHPALMFQALAWSGVALNFWLLPAQADAWAAHRRAWGQGTRLRLALILPEIGPVLIELEVMGTAVALTLTAAGPLAVPALRSRVSLIAARMVHAGLRLMRCHVVHGSAQAPTAAAAVTEPMHLPLSEAALPPALFRAAAETVAAFSPPFQ
jgi:hypothetical protein